MSRSSADTAKDDYQIHLNFLPVSLRGAQCSIYRRRCGSAQETRPIADANAYKLPISDAKDEWDSYWVTMEPADGFEPFTVAPASTNSALARRILFQSLKRAIEGTLATHQYEFPSNSFIQEASLLMKKHAEGHEELIVQPYSLKVAGQTGFLVDFHFRLAGGVTFNRRVQQLSLSLDRNFRRNVSSDSSADFVPCFAAFDANARSYADHVACGYACDVRHDDYRVGVPVSPSSFAACADVPIGRAQGSEFPERPCNSSGLQTEGRLVHPLQDSGCE